MNSLANRSGFGSNKRSDLPTAESDKFKPIKSSRRFALLEVIYGIIILILLILIYNKNNGNDHFSFTSISTSEGFSSKFSNLKLDITNWQQDQDELKFPNSKGALSTSQNSEEDDDDYKHYFVEDSEIKELSKQEKEDFARTTSYYDLNEFGGKPDGADNGDVVLLLIPLRNAEHVLSLMFKHLLNLDYPHSQIDIGLLVSDCDADDKTLEMVFEYSILMQNSTLSELLINEEKAKEADEELQGSTNLFLKYMPQKYLEKVKKQWELPLHSEFNKPFRSVQILEKNFGQIIGQGFSDRHAVKVQGIRRKLMGRARNWLITTTLKPYHSWVYWRDADIEQSPSSVIQDLMKFDFDVIVPNVWRPLPEFLGGEQPYDLNTWMESPAALDLAKTLEEDDVIVEGYAEYPTYRVHLAYLKEDGGDPNQIIEMDGVGGVSILSKARVFRQGVSFPAFTFENHAETEAFGKMAKKMGFRVGGLPHYVIWHIYEPSEDDLRDIAKMERKKRRQKKNDD